MEDVSELFKRHFNLLHKGTTITKTVQDRKEVHNHARKAKRDTLTYMRRHINKDLSPVNTPTPTHIKRGPIKKIEKIQIGSDRTVQANISTTDKSKPEGVSKRLELLHKWKIEKTKLKEQQKAKAKPIFKVYHVPSDLTADIENANKVIKGKPIVPGSASKKSQFAPPNHLFKPPQGIKPINFNTSAKQTQAFKSKFNKLKCTPQTKAKNVPVIKKSAIGDPCNSTMGSTSRPTHKPEEINEKNSKPGNKKSIKEKAKSAVAKFNKDKGDGLLEEVTKNSVPMSYNTKTNRNTRAKQERTKVNARQATLKKLSPAPTQQVTRNTRTTRAKKAIDAEVVQRSPRKAVGWNVKERDLSSNPSDSDSRNTITFRKTPKKSKVPSEDHKDSMTKQFNISQDVITLDDTGEESFKTTLNNSVFIHQKNDNSSDSVGAHSAPQPATNPTAGLVSSEGSSGSTDYPVDYDNCSRTAQSSTPVADDKTPPPVYVSPFVTISRGKNSARKEYQIRRSSGKCDFKETPEVKKILTAHTSPKAGAVYFKRKLEIETQRITGMCNYWDEHIRNPDLPEEACSSIDVAIGQSKLLISKKFEQFRGLISECETENYEAKPVTCEDLHGFWDMILMQVDDLDKRFANLEKLKDNNWEEILPHKVVPVKRLRGRPKKAQTKSKLVAMIQEARKKQKEQGTEQVVLINGLDYPKLLETPPKEKSKSLGSNSTKRNSMRMSLLAKKTKSRCSSSPGLTMMKVSQSIKQGDGLTPARSILKSDVFRSTGKKSVVFKDLEKSPIPLPKTNLFHEEEKENVSDNLINFSPVPLTPRRSARISKLPKL